jgi:hypothetical protein
MKLVLEAIHSKGRDLFDFSGYTGALGETIYIRASDAVEAAGLMVVLGVTGAALSSNKGQPPGLPRRPTGSCTTTTALTQGQAVSIELQRQGVDRAQHEPTQARSAGRSGTKPGRLHFSPARLFRISLNPTGPIFDKSGVKVRTGILELRNSVQSGQVFSPTSCLRI